jgi:DnaJ-class molecular chaperone
LNNKQITIKNKKGNIISNSFQKRIANMGIKRGDCVGALIITFEVVFPLMLSDSALDIIEKVL